VAKNAKSATNYRGYIILEVIMESTDSASPHTYTQWRITAPDAGPDEFVAVATKAAAEARIDSGEAKRLLDSMRAQRKQ